MGIRKQQAAAPRKRKEGIDLKKQFREVQAQLTDKTEEAARLRQVAYEQEPAQTESVIEYFRLGERYFLSSCDGPGYHRCKTLPCAAI